MLTPISSRFPSLREEQREAIGVLFSRSARWSQPEANDKVKMIAARAGIDSDVDGAPKWSLVTTHTARRSAATNLWLAGMPLPEIMQLGGWRTEHQMKKYLVSSGIELAKVSAEHEFFQ